MKVDVDESRCEMVAQRLSAFSIPEDREENSLAWLSQKALGNYYLFLVSICHQTQTLNGDLNGLRYRGWDFLTRSFEASVRERPHLLEPSEWANFSEKSIVELFGATLSFPKERATLIGDLGDTMLRENWKSLDCLYEVSEGRISLGSPNLLSLLSQFKAFSDPVNKKAYFLLGLMQNSRVWVYADRANLGAPVDYHEVRGHLRLGTVVVHDSALASSLLNGIPVNEEDDIAIRKAVFLAIKSISSRLRTGSPMTLHYLFWNLFRNVCQRDTPFCLACPVDLPLPSQYSALIRDGDGTTRCPFSTFCPSAKSDRRFIEHRFETNWY